MQAKKRILPRISPVSLWIAIAFLIAAIRLFTNSFGLGDTYGFLHEKAEPVFLILMLIAFLPLFIFFISAFIHRKENWWLKKENRRKAELKEKFFFICGNILKVSVPVALFSGVIYIAFLAEGKGILIFLLFFVFSYKIN